MKLLESAGDLIDCTDFNDEESEEESDDESVVTNIGSIYDEYDDFYDDMDCNDAPVRLIASLPQEDPYSFMVEAMVQHTDGYGSNTEIQTTQPQKEDDEDYSLNIALQQLLCSHEYVKIPKDMKVKEMTAAMYPGETFSTRCPD